MRAPRSRATRATPRPTSPESTVTGYTALGQAQPASFCSPTIGSAEDVVDAGVGHHLGLAEPSPPARRSGHRPRVGAGRSRAACELRVGPHRDVRCEGRCPRMFAAPRPGRGRSPAVSSTSSASAVTRSIWVSWASAVFMQEAPPKLVVFRGKSVTEMIITAGQQPAADEEEATWSLPTIRSSKRSGSSSWSAASSSSSPSSSTCTAVPARSSFRWPSLDDLVREGAGFAGFAAGDRPGPERSRYRRDHRPRQPDPRPVAAESRSLRLRRHGRGQLPLCVLSPHHPPPLARAKELGFDFKIGSSASSTSSSAARTTARSRSPMRATRSRSPLRHGRADPAVRLPDPRLEVLQRPRLGGRERPRGRKRPVRAELRLRRRLVSCDRAIFFRYMVHTLAEQRGMIATFMPKPFTQLTERLPLPHVARATGRTPSWIPTTRGASVSRRRRMGSSAASRRTRAVQRDHGPDGQLVQAPQARVDGERCDLGARGGS